MNNYCNTCDFCIKNSISAPNDCGICFICKGCLTNKKATCPICKNVSLLGNMFRGGYGCNLCTKESIFTPKCEKCKMVIPLYKYDANNYCIFCICATEQHEIRN